MSYCLNPRCPNPENLAVTNFCVTCGSKLLLKDRYRALKPLGQGGFGKTFLAVDEDKPSQPRCVIKQFFPQAQGTNTVQKAAELFTQEAVRLDELGKHPQIPELLAYFSQDSQQYLAQEFIDGIDLAKELKSNGVFKEAPILALLNDLLPVLEFVHQHQVIHRDIKPENIIRRRSNNQLVLVDFGAAKVATGTALAKTGTAIGSAGFAAPEQNLGRAVFASDIYGLGVTCIYLLTRLHPFDLFDPRECVWVWRNRLHNPVSDHLGSILDKMLESPLNRRYQSVKQVLQDLNYQKNPVVVKQQKTVNSQPSVISYKDSIDAELSELKSQFLSPTNSKSPSPKTNYPAIQPTAKSQIDLELEELKSQFLGSPNPKNPQSHT